MIASSLLCGGVGPGMLVYTMHNSSPDGRLLCRWPLWLAYWGWALHWLLRVLCFQGIQRCKVLQTRSDSRLTNDLSAKLIACIYMHRQRCSPDRHPRTPSRSKQHVREYQVHLRHDLSSPGRKIDGLHDRLSSPLHLLSCLQGGALKSCSGPRQLMLLVLPYTSRHDPGHGPV